MRKEEGIRNSGKDIYFIRYCKTIRHRSNYVNENIGRDRDWETISIN
jgi:hypothetical protein